MTDLRWMPTTTLGTVILDQAIRMINYKMKSRASSIMGSSRVVSYKVKNWVSSSLMTIVMRMRGDRMFLPTLMLFTLSGVK